MNLSRAFLLAALLMPGLAHAQAYQKDTQEPINISSDTLDVDQTKQIAVFKGNVVAVQGTMHLRSDVMTVYYTKKPEAPGKKAAIPAAPAKASIPGVPAEPTGGVSPASGQNAISKIVVNGHVVLATPEESGQGNDGLYEVDKKLLHLTGNVLLTRGENILRGTRLDYNLETGKSLLFGSAGNLPNSTGGRVRGVFLPEDKNKPGTAPKAATPAATTAPAAPTKE